MWLISGLGFLAAGWLLEEYYTIDRVAFDERPDELANLAPRRSEAAVHLLTFDPWGPTESTVTSEPPDVA